MVYNFYFKAFLFIIFFLSSLWVYRGYIQNPDRKLSGQNAALGLVAMLLMVWAVRLPFLREREHDIDTSTWLSAVIAINHYPDKLWTLLNYTDARPLTVFPLLAGSWVGMPVGYGSAEIIGLVLWTGTVLLLFQICKLVGGRSLGLVVTWSLAVFLATICHIFAAYNSEHSSIFMVTAGVTLFFLYIYRRWTSRAVAVATGILLGSLIYAKFQNAPMGLLTGAFLLFSMAGRKDWANAGALLLGCLLPTLFVNVFYGLRGKVDVFWNNYFWNYFYYSFTTQFSSMPIAERFSPGRVIRFIFYATSSGIYVFTLSALAVALPVITFKKWRSGVGEQGIALAFSFLLLLLSIYAVLQSGNNFEHYKLFLFVPLLIFNAFFLARSQPVVRKFAIGFLLLGGVLQTAVNLRYLDRDVAYDPRTETDRKVVGHIQKHSRASDPVVVWGWRDGLLVSSQRPMGYRDVHTFHFSMKSPLIPNWTEDFLEDMEENKPKIFVEAMIRNYSERGDLFLPHDKVPVVREYVRKHYRLVSELDGVKIFHRKEVPTISLLR
ncbi:hypothetical protein GCM10010967_14020 [Dyadobacter beijingensis]|uniref:Dolichyl-phosphate-mannose-protein mannosyltransferase n=1 Tax=Dyadobacter beijingensis TaxID=365489 RepID=A0ABQ2HN19_9BACT|nr:hypothetical protein [Dyadobacter beijingensis]GGM83464.1 hypothetical protein GCM10010967_14020 [Dyadobacter beijingensis]